MNYFGVAPDLLPSTRLTSRQKVIPGITIMVKLNTIAFKVTDEQESFIRRTARARNTSVSELVRSAVLSLETKPGAEYWERFRAFRKKMAAEIKPFTDSEIRELINRGRKY